MRRRTFTTFATLAAFTLTMPAIADTQTPGAVQATAEQIRQLLSGNTISGTWSGTTYKQYYHSNGVTVYVEDGRPPSRGKWRVKEDTNEYDSWWEQTGWTPYVVMMTNDGFAWVNGDTLEPFEVLGGKQVNF